MADKVVNPAPLGLMGFGLTTILLNLVNAGLIGIDALGVILSMGIFYGGLAQVIAGLLEARRGNTFGATAFTSYGLFWFSFVAVNFLPALSLSEAASPASMAAYLIVWGVFTALLTIATFRMNRALQMVFISLTALFFILALGDLTSSAMVKVIGGYEGIFCGSSAVYLAIAGILNEVYGGEVLPIGVVGRGTTKPGE